MTFNIQTKKHGKTYAGEIESIKKKIVKARDAGICDNEGRTIDRDGKGPAAHAGKGDRNRVQKVIDVDALCERAGKNLWPRDEEGRLIND